MIFALRGMARCRDREIQLSGLYAGPQDGRRNINGKCVVIVILLVEFGGGEKFRGDVKTSAEFAVA